jgi:hypothetical protein
MLDLRTGLVYHYIIVYPHLYVSTCVHTYFDGDPFVTLEFVHTVILSAVSPSLTAREQPGLRPHRCDNVSVICD